ncbi:MAG TPA: hypothetical protein VF746_13335 [Longimicrobium sp.]|jgi:hypothetical protein
MSIDNAVQPALNHDLWIRVLAGEPHEVILADAVFDSADESFHARAALLLYDHPKGFTWDHVTALLQSSVIYRVGDAMEVDEVATARVRQCAGLIAAMLPPRDLLDWFPAPTRDRAPTREPGQ